MFKKLLSLRSRLLDAPQNRKLVGQDMLENKYYQYFDDHGNATKRIVEYHKGFRYIETDPLWQRWLIGIDSSPPTQEEVEQDTQNYNARVQIGKEWDRQDEVVMKEWREALKKVRPVRPEKEFKPEGWVPGEQKKKY
jgi:NADH:ubiquinone oxidoreductase subunit